MMKFAEGDKIVYPLHGVGYVDKVENRVILGEERLYYVIRITCDDMTVMIPVDRVDELGVRPIVTEAEIKQALAILSGKGTKMSDDWKVRFNNNKEKIKTGSIFEVSEVVRNLFQRNRIKELSSSEKKLYENAYQLLVDEMSLKLDEKSREYVENMISEKLEDGQKRIERGRKKDELKLKEEKEKEEAELDSGDELDEFDDELEPEDE